MTTIPVKRALLSVSDKTGLVEFARGLTNLGVELISTGGTSVTLQEAGIPHLQVEEVTGLPEMLDGRVKTLHPLIHGGILGKRDKHADQAIQHGLAWIDLVVVNFYPFESALRNEPDMSWEKAVEYVDIGGPTMVRAAAKNFAWVGVVIDPNDYTRVLAELNVHQGLKVETRQQLAAKVFQLTSRYDAAIERFFRAKLDQSPLHPFSMTLGEPVELRYGENPHQKARAYSFGDRQMGVLTAEQVQGKPLSFNNLLDADAAYQCVGEFEAPACVIVKHANPCGAAVADTIEAAYEKAFAADSLSAFGGIVALNRPCSKAIADAISKIFMEVVIAPEFTEEAKAIFATKPNLRLLTMPLMNDATFEVRYITGAMLMQERDTQVLTAADLQCVTERKPTQTEIDSLLFAWRLVKHIKSNAILIAKDNQTVGVGAGQVSRVDAVELALKKSGDRLQETVLASDAFFPFRDSIDKLAGKGVRAIIQPGGSVRDEEVIAACNEQGIAMVFTGKRCFRH